MKLKTGLCKLAPTFKYYYQIQYCMAQYYFQPQKQSFFQVLPPKMSFQPTHSVAKAKIPRLNRCAAFPLVTRRLLVGQLCCHLRKDSASFLNFTTLCHALKTRLKARLQSVKKSCCVFLTVLGEWENCPFYKCVFFIVYCCSQLECYSRLRSRALLLLSVSSFLFYRFLPAAQSWLVFKVLQAFILLDIWKEIGRPLFEATVLKN